MTIAFLDVEASSLHDGSYPTEIGFVRHDFSGGFVALVRPQPEWTDWHLEAEAITDLSRDSIIRFGEPVGHVATAMNDMLAGANVLTDNPAGDGRWVRRLYAAANLTPTFPVYEADGQPIGAAAIFDADILINQAESMAKADFAFTQDLEMIARRIFTGAGLQLHRALDDALYLAIGLAAVDLLPSTDDELVVQEQRLIEIVKATKSKIIGGAVARHIRQGGKDADALRRVLER
jgi:hypothetical protein